MGGDISKVPSTKKWTQEDIDAINIKEEKKDWVVAGAGKEKLSQLPEVGSVKTVKDQISEATAQELEACASQISQPQRDKFKKAIYALAENPKFYAVWQQHHDKIYEKAGKTDLSKTDLSIDAVKYNLKKLTSETSMLVSEATLESVPKLPKYEKTKTYIRTNDKGEYVNDKGEVLKGGQINLLVKEEKFEVQCKESAEAGKKEEVFTMDKKLMEESQDLLDKTVVLKLNGGPAEGMRLDFVMSLIKLDKSGQDENGKAKTIECILDLIGGQATSIKDLSPEKKVKFVVMNSFTTATAKEESAQDEEEKWRSEKLKDFNKKYGIELMQHKAPKVTADADKSPAKWETDATQEWYALGHGNLFTALYASGRLDELVEEGKEYMFVSNSDNLGATMDLKLLTYFANAKYKVDVKGEKPREGSVPFMMEVVDRIETDFKGGHLAVDKKSVNLPHKLTVRENKQCSKEEWSQFLNTSRYQYWNTNNLWINLKALQDKLIENNGILPLPVIGSKMTMVDEEQDRKAQEQAEKGALADFAQKSADARAKAKTHKDLEKKGAANAAQAKSDAYAAQVAADQAQKVAEEALPKGWLSARAERGPETGNFYYYQIEKRKDTDGNEITAPIEKTTTWKAPSWSKREVLQPKTATGAAISCFEGAMAIEVPRTRFMPAKYCHDLLALLSDAYVLKGSCLELEKGKLKPPVVILDVAYKNYSKFQKLIAKGKNVPSLKDCESVVIQGPEVTFADNVILKGNVKFVNSPKKVDDIKVNNNQTGSGKEDEQPEETKQEPPPPPPRPQYDAQVIPAGIYDGGEKGKTYEACGEKPFKPDEDMHWIVK